jgi:hypothetical protein
MTIPTYAFVWQQGEDGQINMNYTQNDVAVDLTGYKLRMDIRSQSDTLLYTFNSSDITEVPSVDNVGAGDNEAVLGSDGTINIVIPRAASLGSGPLAAHLDEPLSYDVFLRDTANLQRKILRGTITIEPSETRWN